jgi:hypothetical protein
VPIGTDIPAALALSGVALIIRKLLPSNCSVTSS